jgi:hypothetical protein
VAGGVGADLMLWFRFEGGRRRDKVLLEDEAEAARSSWLHGKEA